MYGTDGIDGTDGAEGIERGDQAGVVHVAAVWQETPDVYTTLAINEHTPRSEHDGFVLALARARADAIVTTGRILREEPDVTNELAGPAAAGLAAWRREVLGKPSPPLVLILSSGRELPVDHPTLRQQTARVLFTTEHVAAVLGQAMQERGVHVAGVKHPTLASAIDYLQVQHGCRTIVIEAGPNTARHLYGEPPRVDELMLSVFHGPRLPAAARGPAFLTPARIAQVLPRSSSVYTVDEPSGPWRFQRLLR